MRLFGTLFALAVSAASCRAYYSSYIDKPPITMCLKEDFSVCTNVTYPTYCVDLNAVRLDGVRNCTGYPADNAVEAVIVSDVDDEANRCVVLFDAYACQGRALVLNAANRPAAKLHEFDFANRARSIRPCTDALLEWLRDNPNDNGHAYGGAAMPASRLNALMFSRPPQQQQQ